MILRKKNFFFVHVNNFKHSYWIFLALDLKKIHHYIYFVIRYNIICLDNKVCREKSFANTIILWSNFTLKNTLISPEKKIICTLGVHTFREHWYYVWPNAEVLKLFTVQSILKYYITFWWLITTVYHSLI